MVLFSPLVLIAQQDSARHDTLILDKFFQLVGKGIKNTFKNNHKDTLRHKQRQKLKLDFSYELGTQYQALLRNHHFPLDTFALPREINVGVTNIVGGGEVGKMYKPSFGFHSTISCDYKFRRNFRIQSGLQFYFRKETFIEDNDTNERHIVNNFNSNHQYPLDTFKSFQNSFTQIIIPAYFGYSIKRFSGFIGFNFSVYSFTRTKLTTLHDLEFIDPNSSGILNYTIYTTIKFEYLVLNKKLKASTYLAMNARNQGYFDFDLGVKINLKSLK